MEYTVKDKQAHEVVKGDIIWHEQEYREVSKTELSKTDISGIVIEFVTGGIHAIQVNKWHTKFICRVPSSPVMSFKDFHDIAKTFGLTTISENGFIDRHTRHKLKEFYDKYLIGTRSIVPEISDEDINKGIIEQGAKLFGYKPALDSQYAEHFRSAINWLRSQINK